MSPSNASRFASFDGAEIAFSEIGEGQPVILVHGLFSHAELNWIRFGHAQTVADAGFRVILPDLRAHGASAKPQSPAGWPADALARDILALVAHLGVAPQAYDLGGYSLGARTALRAAALGARPRRLVFAGMGLEGLTGATERAAFFRTVIDGRDRTDLALEQRYALAFARSNGVDLESARHLLDQFTSMTPAEIAAAAPMPTLVLCGAEDRENGSAEALANTLPSATYRAIPGNHATAVTRTGLGAAIADFLGQR